ncbi:hypothetical protein [Streptomyces sp. NPDC001404]|uniref:hypothetical protein n=1 Tax=Streptomyces sp. NPDC001404 TaxID=3364571 RepID=UPI0036C76740
MTTPSPGRPPLGNGVRAIIPAEPPPGITSGERAARALGPFQEIPVPAGVLTAARHLIEPLRRSGNEQERTSADMVLALLDAAVAKAAVNLPEV